MVRAHTIDLAALGMERGGEVDELLADLEVFHAASADAGLASERWATRFAAEGAKDNSGPGSAWSARFAAEGVKPRSTSTARWASRFAAEGGKAASSPSRRFAARFTAEGNKSNSRIAR